MTGWEYDELLKDHNGNSEQLYRIKAKYKICICCDKPGKDIFRKLDKKDKDPVLRYGIRYCDEHMEIYRKLNQDLAPLASKVMRSFSNE